MKQILFFLILCLGSINIYAQKDTVYVYRDVSVLVEDIGSHIIVVPDSISNKLATAEQNWRAWHNGEKVSLGYTSEDVSYRWFKRITEKQEKLLFFNKDLGKCLIFNGTKFLEKTLAWEMIIEIIIMFIVSIIAGLYWEDARDEGYLIALIFVVISFSFITSIVMFSLSTALISDLRPFYFSPIGIIPGLILGYYFEQNSKPTNVPRDRPDEEWGSWEGRCW
jgi:hypothetical protein